MSLLDGLIAYYKLDGNANDELGNYNGTPNNVSWVAGKIDKAGSFNGSSSKIDVGSEISLTGNFTLISWIKSAVSISNGKIIIKDKQGSNYAQFFLEILNNKARFGVHSNNSPTSAAVITGTSTIPVGVWTNIVATRDGSNINLYVNGSKEVSTAWSTTQWSSPDTVCIGSSKDNSGTPKNVFDGLIDEVAIYNRALTPQEISELYNSGDGLSYPFTKGMSDIFIGGKRVIDIKLGSKQIKEVYKGDKLIFKI